MIVDKNIDRGTPFDWGKAAGDYAKYRDIYPDAFYQKMLDLGLCRKGQNVLDLGTGTGVLPRNLYRHGAAFTGADISSEQIAQARRLAKEAGQEIEFLVSAAEDLCLAENSFDVVTACQCFFYFDSRRLVPRLKTMLRPGGMLAILEMVWLPRESAVAQASERLVLRYSPHWGGAGRTRTLHAIPEWLGEFGFAVEENLGFDVELAFTKESWNGRMKACRGVGASLPPPQVAAFEKEHLAMLEEMLGGEERFTVPHYASMLLLRNAK